jgi:cyanophycinase
MVFGQSISNKGKLFIIGGGHKPASLLKQTVREAGFKDTDYIMILPMSSGYPDKAIADASRCQKLELNPALGLILRIN